jgi:hypothetical protein
LGKIEQDDLLVTFQLSARESWRCKSGAIERPRPSSARQVEHRVPRMGALEEHGLSSLCLLWD